MKADVYSRLLKLLLLPTCASFAIAAETTTRPAGPNIIVFHTSGQMSGLMGFEGGKILKTPNLDRLAADGVEFTRCYAPCPQSGPSRAGFLTGLYPHENGVTKPGDELSLVADTFTARLKKAGYTCAIVGKWDLPAKDAAKPGFGLTDFVATNKAPSDEPAEKAKPAGVSGAAPGRANGPGTNTAATTTRASQPARMRVGPGATQPATTRPGNTRTNPKRKEAGSTSDSPSPRFALGASKDDNSSPRFALGASKDGDKRKPRSEVSVDASPRFALGAGKDDKTSRSAEPASGGEDDSASGWTRPTVFVNGKKKRVKEYLTDWQAEQACDFLKKKHKAPFFLWVCFDAPHPPLEYPPGDEKELVGTPPRSRSGLAESVDLPVPPANLPQQLMMSGAATIFRQKNQQQIREDRAKYYAMLSRVDEAVGQVLKRLSALKLADNTVVVFTSDCGWPVGDFGLYGEAPAFYEPILRVPLVIRMPADIATCKRVTAVTSAIDLAPTFCELAGLKTPIAMRGRSVLPMLQPGARTEIVDERFFEFDQAPNPVTKTPYKAPARGLVTSQYKFIHYVNGMDVLYDLKSDPQEATNAVGEPRYAQVAKVLRDRLTRWRKGSRDSVKN